jgi:cell division protein FtsW (lipid II flippase)
VIVIAQAIGDAILFVALALFVVAVAGSQVRWLVAVGCASAGLMLVHATVSLFGVSALQAVAPLSFVAFVPSGEHPDAGPTDPGGARWAGRLNKRS